MPSYRTASRPNAVARKRVRVRRKRRRTNVPPAHGLRRKGRAPGSGALARSAAARRRVGASPARAPFTPSPRSRPAMTRVPSDVLKQRFASSVWKSMHNRSQKARMSIRG